MSIEVAIPSEITHPKKRAFLENYPKFQKVFETAKAVGVGESTVYAWQKEDELFQEQVESIKKKLDARRLELYEEELDKRALHGSKNSDILLMFGLKSLNRDKYEGKGIQQTFQGNIIVQSPIPKPDYIEGEVVKVLPAAGRENKQPSGVDNGEKEE